MALKWNGVAVGREVELAAVRGVDQIMSEAVRHAKNNHPWITRTSTLEGGIRPVNKARVVGQNVEGVWGVADVEYGVFLEIGTSKMRARPYLRPAADATYPNLGKRIASFVRKGFRGK